MTSTDKCYSANMWLEPLLSEVALLVGLWVGWVPAWARQSSIAIACEAQADRRVRWCPRPPAHFVAPALHQQHCAQVSEKFAGE
jgi:hypothetical protein